MHKYCEKQRIDIRSQRLMNHGNQRLMSEVQALEEAWKAACKVQGAVIQIPSNFKFLIKPITLKGPCMPQLLLQV